jgi:hypothetical protein
VGLTEGIDRLIRDTNAVVQGSVDIDRYQHVWHDTSYPLVETGQQPWHCDEINIWEFKRFGRGTIGYPRRALLVELKGLN